MNSTLIKSALILLSASVLASCGTNSANTPPGAAPAMPVSTFTVVKQATTTTNQYPGVIVPLNEVELRAEVGGYITAIHIKEGQSVTKGQKLYEIDRTNYQSAYNSALANLEVAKANHARIAKDVQRYTALAEKEAIAKQRVDYAITDLANAASQISAAQATLMTAQANLKRSVIVSPLTGTIGISQVKLGTFVSPGSTLLNTVSTNNPMTVDIDINQKDIQRFLSLQKNSSESMRDSIFSIEQNGQHYDLNGKIIVIDRAVNSGTGTIKVRISFDNPTGILIAGMTCNVNVLNKSPEPQVIIPHKAIMEQLGTYSVFVVGDSSKVEQRIVQLGSEVNQDIIVTDGLAEGEVIVSDGIMKLRPGATVQATNGTEVSAPEAQ